MAEKSQPQPPPLDIVAVIQAAGEADFDRVQVRIAELRRELNALCSVERILMIKLGKTAPAKPPAPTASKASPLANGKHGVTAERRIKIAKYLNHCGTARPAIIAKDLNIPDGSLTFILDHPWFVKDPNGIKLTAEGHRAAGAA